MMNGKGMISLKELREQLGNYPEETKIFFGCPDEANPLEFAGVEKIDKDTVLIMFRLTVYQGQWEI